MTLVKAVALSLIWWLVVMLNPGLSFWQFSGIAVVGAISLLIIVENR